MTLVHLRLRRGEAVAEERMVDSDVLYFCARDGCPHYRGQLGLLAGAETMHCALVQYPPDRICQPFYLEVAEDTRQAQAPDLGATPRRGRSLRVDRSRCIRCLPHWERRRLAGPGGRGMRSA